VWSILFMCSLDYGGFWIARLLTWQLRAPKVHVSRERSRESKRTR
jgi:hypothetical protein